jgi:hypothetical protein
MKINGSYLKNNNRGIGGLNIVNVLKMMIIYDWSVLAKFIFAL